MVSSPKAPKSLKKRDGGNAFEQASTYHARVKVEKRQAVMTAAMDAFLELGYARSSLQQIANRARVSTATLYKRFPTKASLFEAVVPEFWSIAVEQRVHIEPGNPWIGLRTIGHEFAAICKHPKMLGLYRVFISESAQFPELGKSMLTRGKLPYVKRIKDYLDWETQAGNLSGWDNSRAASQFFGIITDQLFWPVLLASGFSVSTEDAAQTIEEAVLTIMARYGCHPL